MLTLPLAKESIEQAHDEARSAAMTVFDKQHFGRHHAKKSIEQLDEEIQKVHLFPVTLTVMSRRH